MLEHDINTIMEDSKTVGKDPFEAWKVYLVAYIDHKQVTGSALRADDYYGMMEERRLYQLSCALDYIWFDDGGPSCTFKYLPHVPVDQQFDTT